MYHLNNGKGQLQPVKYHGSAFCIHWLTCLHPWTHPPIIHQNLSFTGQFVPWTSVNKHLKTWKTNKKPCWCKSISLSRCRIYPVYPSLPPVAFSKPLPMAWKFLCPVSSLYALSVSLGSSKTVVSWERYRFFGGTHHIYVRPNFFLAYPQIFFGLKNGIHKVYLS